MRYETLNDGTVLTDSAVDKLVADAYAALERGAYRVIPNPHKRLGPVRPSEHNRAELVKALSLANA